MADLTSYVNELSLLLVTALAVVFPKRRTLRTLAIAYTVGLGYLVAWSSFFLGFRELGAPDLAAEESYRQGWSAALKSADGYLEHQSLTLFVLFSCLLVLLWSAEWRARSQQNPLRRSDNKH